MKMTDRNFEKELCYDYYPDMEDGNDTETICYPSLFCVLKELVERIEKLEQRLDDLEPLPTWAK
jgi:hypothetical protein